jgi:hypothetical protein
MTANNTINAGLLTLGAFFIGVVPTLFAAHFWYAVVSALVGIGCFVTYELLP